MRIIFAGTPDFAAETLTALLKTEHTLCAVYTQPDRPAGRGRKLTASPVKQIALEHNIPVEQPLNFKSQESLLQLQSYQADLMIVVAYGLLLPQSVLDTPKHGCLNVHASLLPRWRGAAPIQRAILAGDTETGVCIMQMEAGLDTGPVLNSAKCPITEMDTARTLHDRLAELGAQTLIETLSDLMSYQANAIPQTDEDSNYAAKLNKQEANIDWHQSSASILRQVNAFNPWPVAQTLWQDKVMRVWKAEILSATGAAEPGTVVNVSKEGVDVMTSQDILRITELQLPGKKAMSVQNFLNANTLEIGEKLG